MTVQARAAIALQVQQAIAAERPDLAAQLDPNELFTPPQGAPWLRLAFQDGDKLQVAIGGSTSPFRQPLLAFVDVFAPAGSGDGDAVAIAAFVAIAFERFAANTVKFERLRTGPEGRGSGEFAALYRKQIILVFTVSSRG